MSSSSELTEDLLFLPNGLPPFFKSYAYGSFAPPTELVVAEVTANPSKALSGLGLLLTPPLILFTPDSGGGGSFFRIAGGAETALSAGLFSGGGGALLRIPLRKSSAVFFSSLSALTSGGAVDGIVAIFFLGG